MEEAWKHSERNLAVSPTQNIYLEDSCEARCADQFACFACFRCVVHPYNRCGYNNVEVLSGRVAQTDRASDF